MIQITPQMRILVAVEPTDFRRGIDGLARVCKDVLRHDRAFPASMKKFVGRGNRGGRQRPMIKGRQGVRR